GTQCACPQVHRPPEIPGEIESSSPEWRSMTSQGQGHVTEPSNYQQWREKTVRALQDRIALRVSCSALESLRYSRLPDYNSASQQRFARNCPPSRDATQLLFAELVFNMGANFDRALLRKTTSFELC